MTSTPPYRQIRATYTPHTITVYQAYKRSIAEAAVNHQKLNASPDYRPGRMTWVKPSWSWMMYRAGYSYKDPGQERILALSMKHEHFIALLEKGVLSTHNERIAGADAVADAGAVAGEQGPREKTKTSEVRIQWDPERDERLRALPYRSIQIGIPASLSQKWAEEWITEIEDVTEKARGLKAVLDQREDVTTEELVDMGYVPEERAFEVGRDLRQRLRMDVVGP